MKNAQTWDLGPLSETQKKHSVYENLRKYFMTVRTAQTCKWSSDNRHWIKFPPPPPLLPGLKTN